VVVEGDVLELVVLVVVVFVDGDVDVDVFVFFFDVLVVVVAVEAEVVWVAVVVAAVPFAGFRAGSSPASSWPMIASQMAARAAAAPMATRVRVSLMSRRRSFPWIGGSGFVGPVIARSTPRLQCRSRG
jgi:hypothetical protein